MSQDSNESIRKDIKLIEEEEKLSYRLKSETERQKKTFLKEDLNEHRITSTSKQITSQQRPSSRATSFLSAKKIEKNAPNSIKKR